MPRKIQKQVKLSEGDENEGSRIHIFHRLSCSRGVTPVSSETCFQLQGKPNLTFPCRCFSLRSQTATTRNRLAAFNIQLRSCSQTASLSGSFSPFYQPSAIHNKILRTSIISVIAAPSVWEHVPSISRSITLHDGN